MSKIKTLGSLLEQLGALEKKEPASNQQKHLANRPEYGGFMEGISDYWKSLPADKRAEISTNVKTWYSKDSIEERLSDYTAKVYENTTQAEISLEERREWANEACRGFGELFGKSMTELPQFQRDILKIMCAVHLGVIPKNAQGMNLQKGVFVAGAPQIGKTSVFLYLKSTGNFKYRVVTSYELQDIAEKGGIGALDTYKRGKALLIDEIGWETNARHFGTVIDAVEQVLHARHARGLLTHITSNMSLEDLGERYNPHILARIRKMCNIVEANGAKSFI